MADETENLTVHILKGLREDIRANHDELRSEMASVRNDLRSEMASLRDELRETRETLSERIDANTQRIVESELRVATAVTDLHGTLRDVLDVMAAGGGLPGRVAHLERDVAKLEGEVGD